MSSISGVSLSQIDALGNNCKAIGNFKENDQLWTFGNRMIKVIGPESSSRPQNAFFETVDKIIALAIKIILTIGRLLTGQNDENSIQKLETLIDQVDVELKKTLPASTEKDYYTALEGFGTIRRNLEAASKSGMDAYKKACTEGTPYFIKETPEARKAYADRIQTALEKIQKEVLPHLDIKIIEMQKELLAEDEKKVLNIRNVIYYTGPLYATLSEINVLSLAFVTELTKHNISVEHCNRVLKYYGLDKKLTLSGTDVAALLIGLATNCTLKDLQGSTNEELSQKLASLRSLNYEMISADSSMKYRAQLEHDQKLLYVMNDYRDFDPAKEPDKLPVKSLRKFSYTEFLTRHLCYALFDGPRTKFPDGLLFPMIDKDNKLTLKQVSKVVGERGLYAALVKPAIIEKDQKEVPVQLMFRGTYCRDSLLRDISPAETVLNMFFDGPGRASFEIKQDKIAAKVFSEVDALTAGSDRKVEFEVVGHSLGASDAQRALEYIAFKLSEKGKHAFSGMNLFAFNSPNVESDIARRFMDSVEKLKFPFNLRYFDVHHDMVQEFGVKRIGHCGSKKAHPENLSTTVVKFNRKIAEKIEALAKNIFSQAKFLFYKKLEAHCDYSFKLHEIGDPTKFNTTFIQNIFTNSLQDTGLAYGKNVNKVSKILSQKEMDGQLLTNTGRIGRKLKKFGYDALYVLSFGQWSHDYAPTHTSLKKYGQDAKETPEPAEGIA